MRIGTFVKDMCMGHTKVLLWIPVETWLKNAQITIIDSCYSLVMSLAILLFIFATLSAKALEIRCRTQQTTSLYETMTYCSKVISKEGFPHSSNLGGVALSPSKLGR